ncbi:caspase family protein [Labrys neptuniae]|uniref:caspase family protein n=1 Tax=Labrys neptuniae TaxID=376174 RepID=UPI002891603C|nr:caspase family protein [Labrys neptuniae]MDT3381745.1 caspase family protein [Labrys neptuniae]
MVRAPRILTSIRAVLTGAGLVLASPVLAADSYALVVGIDAYDAPINSLHGAVNDAKDIAQALTKAGVKKLTLITDKQATKPNILAAWKELMDQAQPGDTFYFTYAGHGSREPGKPNDPDSPDGLNNILVMTDFAPKLPGALNRIVDKEMAVLLKQAAARQVYPIVVIDACNSGTMYRSVTLGLTYRATPQAKISREELLEFAPPVPDVSTKIAANDPFTFLAGVADDKLVPEVAIDGQPRGALSYAFSRALEGKADANHDGVTTEKELVAFVRAFVLQATQSQQVSQSFPDISRDIPVFRSVAAGPAGSQDDIVKAIAVAEQVAANTQLKLAVRNGNLAEAPPGATLVSDEAGADLVYDAAAGTVEKRVAGVVAEGVQPSGLGGIVAKWRAISFLQAMAGGSIQPFEVAGGSRTFNRGEKLTVGLAASNHRFMTLFNLPPNGKVEFLYPTSQAERDEDWSGKPFTLPLQVRDPPFGAEHLVAILSDQPLDQLHTALQKLSSPQAAQDLPDTLKNALSGQSVTVGIANVFTSAGTP